MTSFNHDEIGGSDLYKRNILDHNRSPRNKRKMSEATVCWRDVNMSCGDDVEIFIKIEDGVITDISFDGVGCAISQASVSMLTEKIRGLTVEQANLFSENDLFELLGVEVGPARIKCATLGLKTIKKALNQKNDE